MHWYREYSYFKPFEISCQKIQFPHKLLLHTLLLCNTYFPLSEERNSVSPRRIKDFILTRPFSASTNTRTYLDQSIGKYLNLWNIRLREKHVISGPSLKQTKLAQTAKFGCLNLFLKYNYLRFIFSYASSSSFGLSGFGFATGDHLLLQTQFFWQSFTPDTLPDPTELGSGCIYIYIRSKSNAKIPSCEQRR